MRVLMCLGPVSAFTGFHDACPGSVVDGTYSDLNKKTIFAAPLPLLERVWVRDYA